MAGDWIKWCKGLARKREVMRMAKYLQMPPDQVAGITMRFWEWVDDNGTIGPDGNGIVTDLALHPSVVDELVGVTHFGEALADAGWLVVNGAQTTLPNFGRHNGKTAKSRALTKNRVEEHRNATSNAPVTSKTLPEKRREESIKTPNPLSGGARSELFDLKSGNANGVASAEAEAIYRAYPRKTLKRERALAALRVVVGEIGAPALRAAVVKYSQSVLEDGIRSVPALDKWLGNGCWKDWLPKPTPAVAPVPVAEGPSETLMQLRDVLHEKAPLTANQRALVPMLAEHLTSHDLTLLSAGDRERMASLVEQPVAA
jgi:hypothetical protein